MKIVFQRFFFSLIDYDESQKQIGTQELKTNSSLFGNTIQALFFKLDEVGPVLHVTCDRWYITRYIKLLEFAYKSSSVSVTVK